MVRTISLDDFIAEAKSQGVPRAHVAFKCPMCGTIQSATDLIGAGAGKDFDEVEKYLGFSCIGRWTGAKGPRNAIDSHSCDWTLGGLFKTHKLEVLTPDGKAHPRFELATPSEAQAHALAQRNHKEQTDETA